MKQIFLPVIFLVLVTVTSSGYTSTSDECIIEIDNDTIFGTWNNSCTYIIKKDAVLPIGKSLEIEPGCKILLYPDVRIKIEGELIAQGSEENPIVFSSFDLNNYWNCLYFENAEAVSIKHCNFENTVKKDSRRGALHFGIYSNIFKISNCTFKNNKSGAVFIDRLRNRTETMAIEYNTVLNGEDFGFSVFGGDFGIINFKNNKIEGKIYTFDFPYNERVGFTGIRVGEVFVSKINFRDNKISNASFKYDIERRFFNHPGGGILVQPNASRLINDITFENDTLQYNEGKFAAVYAQCDSSISVKNLLVERNSAVIGGGYFSADNLNIENTKFLNNQNIDSRYSPDAGGGGLTVEHRFSSSKVEITNSEFFQNRAQDGNGGGLKFIGNNNALDEINIRNTKFGDNLADRNGGAVYIENYKQIDKVLFDAGNSFLNNLAEIGIIGGGGILVQQIDSITNFRVHNSALISNHQSGYGNGGFLSLNQVGSIGTFSYANNKHIESVSSPKGYGGLVYLGIVSADTITFTGNDGISSTSEKSGGAVFVENNARINTLLFLENGFVSSESKNGTGGLFSANVKHTGNISVRSNTINSSKATVDAGGTFFLKAESNKVIDISGNTLGSTHTNTGGGFAYIEINSNDTILIQQNQVNTSLASGYGGFIQLKYNGALPISKFRFYKNTIQNASAGKSGGTLYFTGNVYDTNSGIEILENVIGQKSESKLEGGFVFMRGNFENAIYIENNEIENAKAQMRGGSFFIENFADSLNRVYFNENIVGSTTESLTEKGGYAYINSKILDEIKITGNNLKNSKAGMSGGAFWIENQNDTNSSNLVVADNVVGVSKSFESGGFVYLKTNALDVVFLENNEVQDSTVAYGSGGCIHIESNIVNQFISRDNTIAQSVAHYGDGGFVNLQAHTLGSYHQNNNSFTRRFSAFGNGGVLAVKTQTINELCVSGNKSTGSFFANNGGYLAIESDFLSDSTILNIQNNKLGSSAFVHNNGAVFYIKGKINNDIYFIKNTFSENIRAINNGGVVFIHNSHGRNNKVLFQQNSVSNNTKEISLQANNGGFLHFEGFFNTNYFGFNNDTIEATITQVDSVGGVFYLKNNFDNKRINHIEINENRFSNLKSTVNGSVLSIVAKIDTSFTFKNNKVNSTVVMGENMPDKNFDGNIYVRNTDPEGLNSLLVNSNQFAATGINNGGGAILKYEGNHVQKAKVAINKVKMANTSKEGLFSFYTDSISSFRALDNRYEHIQAGVGGIYHFSGNQKTRLNTIEILRDEITNAFALGEASGLYLDAATVDSLTIDGLAVTESHANGSGGLVSGREGILMNQMFFKNNRIENSSSGENGGVVSLVGKINNVCFENDSIINFTAVKNGGALHLVGLENNYRIGQVKVTNTMFQNNRKLQTGGKGGAVYLHTVDSVELTANFFDQAIASGSGGAISSQYNHHFLLDSSEFIWNESLEKNGGALALENFGLFKSGYNKINSNFAKNGKGGGIFINYGYVDLVNDSIVYCSAQLGGGMYLDNYAGNIDSVCFIRNYTAFQQENISFGAGIYFNKNLESQEVVLFDNKFYRNSSIRGGAIYCDSSNVKIVRGIFAFNNTKEHGGAVYMDAGSAGSRFYNCIFQSNEIDALEENFVFEDCPAAGIQLIFRNSGEADTTKIINCLFTSNQGMAVAVHPNSSIDSKNRCLILNSELYYNKYFSQEHFQFCPDNKFIIPEYSNIQNIDTSRFKSCIKEPPRWGPGFTYCLDNNSFNIDAGHPGKMYFDSCGNGDLTNDIGITGGPYGFCDCNATIIKDDEACMTNLEEFAQNIFSVYPNPTHGLITISFDKPNLNKLEIRVYSLYGKLMLNHVFNEGISNQTKQLDLSGLPQGSYIIRLQDDKRLVAAKIIIL